MSEPQKTFVFDLDGTILTRAPLINGKPDYHQTTVKDKMVLIGQDIRRRGHRIVIHTARGMRSIGLAADVAGEDPASACRAAWGNFVMKQLDEAGFPWDELIFGKPAGDWYIDDKGIEALEFMEHYMLGMKGESVT